ncbi:MAG: 2-C-methyl-D-erythritol 4-phosphate cytidylyltransferase [Defluviitaleaceae bacterium]|nr:2-C-methyl-D-erythritol 4-phosphate cytidylyltransferase [Defluviitaleaceae bacterium]
MQVSVIIAAAGNGRRLGGDKPKQFQLLGGRPVLAHSLELFNRLAFIHEIYVAIPGDYISHTQEIISRYGITKVRKILPGGANRAESVNLALKQLSNTDIVLIHDGARPFASEELIKTVVDVAASYGAAVAGIPLTDTIKETDDSGKVITTPDRSRFWQVQTPQGFTYDVITKAYTQGCLSQVTDDSTLVENMGQAVQMVKSHPGNIKITTKEDLLLGELILRR